MGSVIFPKLWIFFKTFLYLEITFKPVCVGQITCCTPRFVRLDILEPKESRKNTVDQTQINLLYITNFFSVKDIAIEQETNRALNNLF